MVKAWKQMVKDREYEEELIYGNMTAVGKRVEGLTEENRRRYTKLVLYIYRLLRDATIWEEELSI